MKELVINFEEVQSTLAPIFGNQPVRLVIDGESALISKSKPKKAETPKGSGESALISNPKQKKVYKSMGSLNAYANPEMIPGEREAYIQAVVEKYVKNRYS